jgi:transcriptional regulator with XRE-family HTH domain
MAAGDLQVVLGQNLRRWRLLRNLSQEEFAEVLGFHRTYVGSLERGERNVSLKSVERFAAKLGLKPIVLLEPSDDLK